MVAECQWLTQTKCPLRRGLAAVALDLAVVAKRHVVSRRAVNIDQVIALALR